MKHVKVTRAFNSDRNRLADLEAPTPIKWQLGDGTVPATRCGLCNRPTPMLVDGLGFDCCAPSTEQYEYWDESESGTYRLTTGQFLLASVVVIIGAIALVL